jgi:hypothetical protein
VVLNWTILVALHYATKHDISIAVRMLLDRGAESSVVNDKDERPLDLAPTLGGKTTKRILKEHLYLEELSKATGLSVRMSPNYAHSISFESKLISYRKNFYKRTSTNYLLSCHGFLSLSLPG